MNQLLMVVDRNELSNSDLTGLSQYFDSKLNCGYSIVAVASRELSGGQGEDLDRRIKNDVMVSLRERTIVYPIR